MLTEIGHLRQSGHKMRGIAAALNRKVPPTRRGSAWRLEHVARIIRSGKRAPLIRKVGGAICIFGNPRFGRESP